MSEYFLSSRRQEALTALAQAEDDRNALSEHAGLLESQLTIVQSQDRCELATYHLCHACAVSAKVAFAVAIQRWHTWTVLDKERKSSLNESKRGLLNIAEVTALLAAAEKERDSMRGSMRQQQQSHEQRTRELQAQFDEGEAAGSRLAHYLRTECIELLLASQPRAQLVCPIISSTTTCPICSISSPSSSHHYHYHHHYRPPPLLLPCHAFPSACL